MYLAKWVTEFYEAAKGDTGNQSTRTLNEWELIQMKEKEKFERKKLNQL